MIDPSDIERMNMEIDGVLPPEEAARLHESLASSREAAAYYNGLKAAVSAVETTGDPAPPPHLETRILSRVPWRQGQAGPAPGGFFERAGRWFRPPALRYAAVFGCGIVTGLLLYFAINFNGGDAGGEFNNAYSTGTMRQITEVEGLTQTQDHRVDIDQARGQVSLYESENILLTEVLLDAPWTIRWTLQFDPKDVVFEGYRRFDNETGDIDVARSEMRVSQTGDARYLFFFTRKAPSVDPMVIRLFAADRLLLEQPLTPDPAG
jgi:hypothetical protein